MVQIASDDLDPVVLIGEHLAACRILLVEDDPDQRHLYRLLLTQANYKVIDVPDGEQALLSLESDDEGYGLLLVDLGLPGMRGDVLISSVKAQKRPIKTILMSSHPELRKVAQYCGADASFFKLNITQLSPLVKKLLIEKALVDRMVSGEN